MMAEELLIPNESDADPTTKSRNKLRVAVIFCASLLVIAAIASVVLYFVVFGQHDASDIPSSAMYDFVVIGSGPSGSIVAARLAENGYCVLLLEAGNASQFELNGTLTVTAETNLTIFDVPLDWNVITANASYSSHYVFHPQGDVTPLCGKSVGGSGAINAMIYMRGTVSDFVAQNGWMGGWTNYSRLLSYYMASENNTDAALANTSYHGQAGNVHIAHNFDFRDNALSQLFIASCLNNSFQHIADFNLPNRTRNVCGNYQFLIDADTRNQTVRDSVGRAFYRNGIKPATLTVKANAMAVELIFDETKRKATGVRFVDFAGPEAAVWKTVHVQKEVVLSAGTLNTPTILMQSGIGDADVLRNEFAFESADIVLNNSQIGRNYIDGVFTFVQWNVSDDLVDNFTLCTPWGSSFGADSASDTKRCAAEWNTYLGYGAARNSSVFDSTGFNVGGFFKSPFSSEKWGNDIQVTLQPFDILRRHNATNILTAQIALNLPKSRGHLEWTQLNRFASRNSEAMVVDGSNIEVVGNYLQQQDDVSALVFGLNVTRGILGSDPIRRFVRRELSPGPSVNGEEAMREYVVRNKGSADHIAGTCKMGEVVDGALKVIGLDNVRIADASIMPSLTSGNTHATCMMIGEYAADLILNAR